MSTTGAIIGGSLNALGAIYGGISASKAVKQARQNVEAQRQKNKNWFDMRYNEDATQRADAQRILTQTEESIKQRNRQAAGVAAVIRAHRAADWKHFEAEKDVYPNLRWMPTTSATQDPVHASFWSQKLTLPVDDAFWGRHHPGERWGCKRTCEHTDEPVTDLGGTVADYRDTASKGLHGNPAETGQLFSDDHPYYTQACSGADRAVESLLKEKELTREIDHVKENIREIAKSIGIEVPTNEMSFEEANEMRGNPHYKEDERYRDNCQSSVVANELHRRGFNVEAYGNSKIKNTTPFALSYKTEAAWQDADGNIPTSKVVSFIKGQHRTVDRRGYVRVVPERYTNAEIARNIDNAMAEEGRYHISWEWKVKNNGKRIGHIITAERLNDGKLRFYDPQSGEIVKLNISKVKDSVKILRVDNLRVNPDIIRGVVKRAGTAGDAPVMYTTQKTFWKRNGVKNYVVGNELKHISLAPEQKEHRKELQRVAIAKFKGTEVENKFRIKITASGIKEFLNQPHEQYFEKNELVKDLPDLIRNAGYLKTIPYHKDNKYIKAAHIYEVKIKGRNSYLIVRENMDGESMFHSISDSLII